MARGEAGGRAKERHAVAAARPINPVERVWLCVRERFLAHRLRADYKAGLEAACAAGKALAGEPGRLASLTAYPYLLRSEHS